VENKRWERFVTEQIRRWKMIIAQNLLRRREDSVLPVFYEDLQSSTQMTVSPSVIPNAVEIMV
jgi:hypothetical protein